MVFYYLFSVTRRDLDSAGQMIDLGHHICDSFAAHSEYATFFLTIVRSSFKMIVSTECYLDQVGILIKTIQESRLEV